MCTKYFSPMLNYYKCPNCMNKSDQFMKPYIKPNFRLIELRTSGYVAGGNIMTGSATKVASGDGGSGTGTGGTGSEGGMWGDEAASFRDNIWD